MPTKRVRKPIILVIEDYGDSREMLQLLLKSMRYRVLAAANGHEALELAASNHLDLILTDFGLPGMDGPTVVRKLRQLSDRFRQIPIIMLTAFEGDAYYYAALRAGCTGFLTKPLDVERLHDLIEELLLANCDETDDTPNGVEFRKS